MVSFPMVVGAQSSDIPFVIQSTLAARDYVVSLQIIPAFEVGEPSRATVLTVTLCALQRFVANCAITGISVSAKRRAV
jgi:hypothetical protein